MVPEIRIQSCNPASVRPNGDFVLYWMNAFRRTTWNFSLARAVHWAAELNKPLVVFEGLRCAYAWASERFHRFVMDGMIENARLLRKRPVYYYPYLEKNTRAGKGLIAALARHACVVITDDYPCFFLPAMVASAAEKMRVRFEKVDSNGLLPLRAADKVYHRAYDFRRFLQHNLPFFLGEFLNPDPLEGQVLPAISSLPDDIIERWPPTDLHELADRPATILGELHIDHTVRATDKKGGSGAAFQCLKVFLNRHLSNYDENRNSPDNDVTSWLSPYLHFGHISSHQIFHEIATHEKWTPNRLSHTRDGRKSGWWGMSKSAEAFLDQLVTWRELGYNMCWQRENYDTYESLPQWARKSLDLHAGDLRPYIYTPEQFERAETHDQLWNAAQKQLVREGRIHNYMRMLWGKKILEWTHHPKTALEIMIHLNNKYALDGRDPNSYSGIFWILGRYDRAWGPERPIFGKVRYMSSENTARKFRVQGYIQRYSQQLRLFD